MQAPFELIAPVRGDTPVLVEVPHAATAIPERFLDAMSLPGGAVQRDADLFVDRLWEQAPAEGATLLVARYSRYVVDLNRAHNDVDATAFAGAPPREPQPRGVIWSATTDGQRLLKRPLTADELADRLNVVHRPYHSTLERELRRLHDRFGFAILLAAHSMPSTGRAAHSDRGARRADVVPGTRGRSTAAADLISLVEAHFRGAGLSVRHDDPYRGGFTTGHYGRPADGWHAIQIELNRALYMDERSCEPRPGDFERLQELLRLLVVRLGKLPL